MPKKLITCQTCGKRRRYFSGQTCHTCYNHARFGMPRTRRAVPRGDDGPPPADTTRWGLTLSRCLEPAEDLAERSRRVEVYARQVASAGRIDFAAPELRQGGAPREAS